MGADHQEGGAVRGLSLTATHQFSSLMFAERITLAREQLHTKMAGTAAAVCGVIQLSRLVLGQGNELPHIVDRQCIVGPQDQIKPVANP